MTAAGDPSGAEPGHFDWAAARRRLAETAEAIAASDDPTPDMLARTLRQRAAALAVPAADGASGETLQTVQFRLGGTRYALDASVAVEAAAVTRLTRLPGAPPFYLGLIYRRGSVFPLLDIRPLLGAGSEAAEPVRQVILVEADGVALGIAAGAIEGLAMLRLTELAATDGRTGGIVRGIGPGHVLLLDGPRLLGDARLVVNEHPAASAGSGAWGA